MINFISGLIIGGLIGIGIMCFLQINRYNELQDRIDLVIRIIKTRQNIENSRNRILNILGGDVDDE